MVEPEPAEYMRLCYLYPDDNGKANGFFHIPGTDSCMRIDGYIRSTYGHYTTTTGGIEDPDHASWSYRARLTIDVRNETEWGTLHSELRFQADGDAGADATTGIDRARINVAGFRLGYSTDYWESAHGGAVDSPAIEDGMYNSDESLFFDYTYEYDGFALTAGVQDSTGTTADMETPDYYVGVKYSESWGWLAATYIYDQNGVDAGTVSATGADAWKVSFLLKDIADTGWNFGAWYMSDGADATGYVTGGYGATGALVDNQWGIAFDGGISDTLDGYVLYSAAESDATSTSYLNTKELAIGLIWKPIDGLLIQTEYVTYESDYVLAIDDTDTNSFIVRVVRSW